jgi:hypothetical protein
LQAFVAKLTPADLEAFAKSLKSGTDNGSKMASLDLADPAVA